MLNLLDKMYTSYYINVVDESALTNHSNVVLP